MDGSGPTSNWLQTLAVIWMDLGRAKKSSFWKILDPTKLLSTNMQILAKKIEFGSWLSWGCDNSGPGQNQCFCMSGP